MRQQSRFAFNTIVLYLLLQAPQASGQLLVVPAQVPPQYPQQAAGKPFAVAKDAKPCLPSGAHQYDDGGVCTITVHRAVPGSPLPVVVPKGTVVQIVVDGRSPLESIQFVQSLDAVPAQDFGLALAKLFSPGLSALTIRSGGKLAAPIANFEKDKQADVAKTLQTAQDALSSVAADQASFKNGDLKFADGKCSPAPVGSDATFDCAKQVLLTEGDAAAKLPVPVAEIQLLDSDIIARVNACATLPTAIPKPKDAVGDDANASPEYRAEMQRQYCLTLAESLQERETVLHTALTEVQDKITATNALVKALKSLPGSGNFVAKITGSVNKKATIKISAKDVVSGTSTDIATVVITWQGSNFALSTGLLLSTLPNRIYSNTPIVVNGLPVLDSGGKVTTIVTENDTRPSVVTPLAMLNYEFTRRNYAGGKFGMLVSGGLGANLTTKSADYAVGMSFRFRELLFSPLLHLGRETYLSNGIAVGQKLGSSPPSLTTEQHFKPAVGFAISYRVPVP